MKSAALHKATRGQISLTIAFCAFHVLGTMALGQVVSQAKPLGIVAIGPSLVFDHPDATLVEMLIQRGFFDIAIETCRDRRRILADNQLDAEAKWLMLEMHALAAKVASNPAIVEDPESVVKLLSSNQTIVENNQASNRFYWLKLQQNWCRWLVLRRLQAAYLAVPARKTLREWSLATIRLCLAEVESLPSQIQKAPANIAKANGKSTPSPEQWSSLINEVFLLQTDFQLLRALYYPAKSTERIAAATEMLTSIDQAELRIRSDWSGRPNIDLARFAALIHVERPEEALAGIKKLDQQLRAPIDGMPRQGNRWQIRIATLAAEACRNLGNIKESNDWINSIGGWTVAPEIAIEHFANLVTSSSGQTASETELANALQVKDLIGERFGSYWQQRADAILLSKNPLSTNGSKPTALPASELLRVKLLESEAKQLLAAKRWNEAIEKLSQAELSAATAGSETKALEIGIQAASVLFTIGRKDLAEGEFHRVAFAYRNEPKAPEAAIMSVLRFEKISRFEATGQPLSPTDEEAKLNQQTYQERLMDIINAWPNSAQAKQAVTKLDRLLLATDQLPELLALWSRRLDQIANTPAVLDRDSRLGSDFDHALCRLVLVTTSTQDAWLDRYIYSSEAMKWIRPSLEELQTKILSQASSEDSESFRSLISNLGDFGRWPNRNASGSSTSIRTGPSLGIVSIMNQAAASGFSAPLGELIANLESIQLDRISDLAMKWTTTELFFQRLIRSGLNVPIEAKELTDLRYCVEMLSKLEQDEKSGWGSIGMFQSKQFGRSLKFYRVAIQCWSGDENAGTSAIKAEIAAESSSPWWNYRTARLFQTLPQQRGQAINQFRQLAKGFPVGSEPWLESRARTVQSLRQLGDTKQANELTALVFAMHATISKQWRSRFEP